MFPSILALRTIQYRHYQRVSYPQESEDFASMYTAPPFQENIRQVSSFLRCCYFFLVVKSVHVFVYWRYQAIHRRDILVRRNAAPVKSSRPLVFLLLQSKDRQCSLTKQQQKARVALMPPSGWRIQYLGDIPLHPFLQSLVNWFRSHLSNESCPHFRPFLYNHGLFCVAGTGTLPRETVFEGHSVTMSLKRRGTVCFCRLFQ